MKLVSQRKVLRIPRTCKTIKDVLKDAELNCKAGKVDRMIIIVTDAETGGVRMSFTGGFKRSSELIGCLEIAKANIIEDL